MLPQWLKPYISPIVNLRSFDFLIKTYIECLGYLFPVLIAYLCTENIKKTLLMLVIVILVRFLVAFYQIKRSQQQPPKVIKYASCHRSFYIDPVEKGKLQKQCEIKYEEYKKKQHQKSSEEKKAKQTQAQTVMKQLQQRESKIFCKWQ